MAIAFFFDTILVNIYNFRNIFLLEDILFPNFDKVTGCINEKNWFV